MASERTLEILLSAKAFEELDVSEQRSRLAQYMADWFGPAPINTVDNVRWSARLRACATKMKISAGEVLELVIPVARQLHSDAVYQREAERIRDEDQRIADELDRAEVEDTDLPTSTGVLALTCQPVQELTIAPKARCEQVRTHRAKR